VEKAIFTENHYAYFYYKQLIEKQNKSKGSNSSNLSANKVL